MPDANSETLLMKLKVIKKYKNAVIYFCICDIPYSHFLEYPGSTTTTTTTTVLQIDYVNYTGPGYSEKCE